MFRVRWSNTSVFFNFTGSVRARSERRIGNRPAGYCLILIGILIIVALFERHRKTVSESPLLYPSTKAAQSRTGSKRRVAII
jgi:hypothetical protein